ncbi:putative Similar to chemotaxis histidine kinase [Desulfamplus magnetovallimortis]|uniref:Chemotaxis protein CheA n=1 Tax=Desulfamplus magnetovallimortis TaxID=1246637 RepID=A0A1W1HEP1_9BACT|nr:chemotaxis protein CheA [Desulfamplus magnetovallimortis]SLM30842.1 putative Similar to chemotaxis histidine kinase [Desulfamplus magnetovallimortis]
MPNHNTLESMLEELSLEFVLADISDPDTFKPMLHILKNFFKTAKNHGFSELAEDAARAGKIAKAIIEGTTSDIDNQFDSLNLIISEMKSFLHLATQMPEKKSDITKGTGYQKTETDLIKNDSKNNLSVEPEKTPLNKSDTENHLEESALIHPGTLPSYLNLEDFAEFLSMQTTNLANMETLILNIEKNRDLDFSRGEIKRIFHTAKGEAGFLGLKDVEAVCHRAEDLMSSDELLSNSVDLLLSVKDWLEATFMLYSGKASSADNIPDTDYLLDLLDRHKNSLSSDYENENNFAEKLHKISDKKTTDSIDEEKTLETVPEELSGKKPASGKPSEPQQFSPVIAESINVDASRLDRLVEMIGEIAIAESMITQSREITKNLSSDLLRALNTLHKTTRELQTLGLGLRMVPLKATFSRMERVVRDLSRKVNKKIRFVMTGENTELDKNLVEKLGDPLIHIIRNSVDHGIEVDEMQRLDAGKPETATIEIRAFHKGGHLFIEVEDDGRGIDQERLMDKAKKSGLISEDADIFNIDKAFLMNLVFHPGLSTATKITDVSGRGVGMDVVKKSIESCRGKVSITSTSGKGTICTIKLPLTLSIIDGLVIRVAQEHYVIPTLSVVTSMKVRKEQVSKIFQTNETITTLGTILPLFRLSKLFDIKGNTSSLPWEGIVVIVEDNGMQTALLADELLGKQNTVIKSMGPGMENIKGVSGATIMPDGRVSLILDVSGIVELSHSDFNGKQA